MKKLKDFCKKHAKKIAIGCSVLGAACTFIAGYKVGYNVRDGEDWDVEVYFVKKDRESTINAITESTEQGA